MELSWITSPTGRRVLEHWADPRASWLWTGDGQALLWRNIAARFFNGRPRKRSGAAEIVPIRGQVARLVRLGSPNRPSLSRMQFLAGDRPVSVTCACTPLLLPDAQPALLVVDVDPIAPELLEAAGARDPALEALLPPGTEYLVVDDDGQIAGGSPWALGRYAPALENAGLPEFDAEHHGQLATEGGRVGITWLKASPQDASLLLFDAVETSQAPVAPPTATFDASPAEPLLPIGLLPVEAPAPTPPAAEAEEPWVEPLKPAAAGGLSSLFDRLMDDGVLFTPLAPEEESPPPVGPEPEAIAEPAGPPADVAAASAAAEVVEAGEPPTGGGSIAEMPMAEESGAGQSPAQAPAAAPVTAAEPSEEPEPGPTVRDPESVERVSRYNFDELSRILNDRVGSGNGGEALRGGQMPVRPAPAVPSATPEGALVTLGGETLVLNRLPLGILVFRDQQVLFANRAITEMTGHDSVESLRRAGLAAIFPAAGGDAQQAGPVNHLVQRDGTLVPVTARLQSVSWQGKPALMLSASMTEVRTGHEAAVRAFAEHLATARADGFIELARSGVLTHVSADARLLLKRGEDQLLGRPVSLLAAPDEIAGLREFLERPARFAETSRPAITFKGIDAGLELMLFAQGQAGVISSYFGFVRQPGGASLPALPPEGGDAGLLARLSRGVRRPLNTVIGFSDLIGTAAFGEIENQRYLEYARDIKTAGMEIAALVDELDDFARLRDGRYAPRLTDIDLAVLLQSSVTRIRGQANAARVLVRSAISERLPRVRADRTSLAQAILNLLASAIDQTPQDGSVVLSAQTDDSGNVVVNVRDSARNVADFGERFVVFRDGVGRDGAPLVPVRSSVGLALTRALLAVSQASLAVDPAAGSGTLFSLTLPADSVVERRELPGPTG